MNKRREIMETMFLSFTAEITGGGLLRKTGANDSFHHQTK
jgi:hypothetical protein